jgi:molybdenum cofactor guanylyltransferase
VHHQHKRSPTEFYAIIACGGKSSRMGTDKCMLDYHGKAQCYYLYDMMEPYFDKVFISCNNEQAVKFEAAYPVIIDHDDYANTGPMGALLSAFDKYPGKHFVMIGCDYPFFTARDMELFLASVGPEKSPAAFYNEQQQLFEPLLAFYPYAAAVVLKQMHSKKQCSLQHFLRDANAATFFPQNTLAIKSVDLFEMFKEVRSRIINK